MKTRSGSVTSRRELWTRSLGVFSLVVATAALNGCVFSIGPRVNAKADDNFFVPRSGSMLIVENNVGEIEVIADPSATELRAEVTRIGKGRTIKAAHEALDAIDVVFRPRPSNPDVFEAVVHHPKPRRGKQYKVNWAIWAPPDMAVEITNDVGDIEIDGFGHGLVLTNDVGDVLIHSVAGGVTASIDVGHVEVYASGPIDVQTDVGDVEVTVIDEGADPVKIKTDVGDAWVSVPSSWRGSVKGVTDVGRTRVRSLGEPVRVHRHRKHHFEGAIGDGAGVIDLRTDVGNATVKVRKGEAQ